jgi:FkbH-like protein
MLVSLADTGILIGVATKNDPYMVEQVFKRTDLIISPGMLFPVESHWGPKSESVSRILRTWNIGAESVVFIDDSAMEIAEVKTAFPQITGFVFPAAPDSGLKDLLETLRDLCGKAAVSDEDRLRAASVRQSRHLTAEISQGKAEEFLAQVQAEITLTYNRPDQRAFDLINKTNQFNLNGRRIDESAWRARNNNPRFFLLSVSYRDKFGPLGTIAVVSGTCQKPVPLLDIWVMSCRAFSRRIEHQIAMSLFDFLDADILNLALVSTERNGPIREFIDSSGAVQDVPYTQMQRESFLAHCPQLFAKVQVT